jgi:ATP-binding cassette, subfamily B, bacterial MsbA
MNSNFKSVSLIIKPFKNKYLFVVFIAIVAAVFETIGYYSFMPFLDILIGKSDLKYNFFGTTFDLNTFAYFNDNIILSVGLLIILIFIIRFSLTMMRLITTQRLNWDLRNYYTEKLASDYTNSTLSYLNSQKHGEILNNSLSETNRTAAAITALIELFSKGSIIIILYLTLFITNIFGTLIITGFTILVWALIKGYVSRFSENIGSDRLLKSQQLTTLASENFSAIRNSKIFNAQNINLKRFRIRLKEYSKILLKYNVVLGIPTPATELLLVFSFVVLVIFLNLSSGNSLTNFSELTIYFIICQRIFQYSSNLIAQRVKYLSLLPSLKLVNDLLKKNLPKENLDEGLVINNIKKELSFNNIFFGYLNDKIILKNINFSIKPKSVTAIFGESGIGKSTIADLILRLYDPSKGKILINDENIKKYNLLDWRSRIGYVPQDPFFYNMSVIDNLLIGMKSIDKQRVINICKLVNAHNFIIKLSDSYNTNIGDRAVSLSGGQKQRLALARALIKDPDILILDEATSALDVKNEEIISELIKNLSDNQTIIMISHNISNMKIADKIYAMTSAGNIIEKKYSDLQ